MDMGQVDTGPARRRRRTSTGRPAVGVDQLIADDGPADVALTLVARAATIPLGARPAFDGYTLNGTSPGPTIRAELGQLVEVRLVNESVPAGITLHWHGVDVPNAADGVAGVTQDAVPPGGEYTYRFRVRQVGTFWYHSHQVAHEQVARGLFGALVITPAGRGRPGPAGRGAPLRRPAARSTASPATCGWTPRRGSGSGSG